VGVCLFGFCNVWFCVRVCFYVLFLGYGFCNMCVCVCFCGRGVFNVWVFVGMGFLMCGV